METHNSTAYIIWIDTTTPITAERGLNYRPVMCGTSNGFRMSRESIAFRNKCDDEWDRTESGYGSWSMDLSGHAISLLATDAATKSNFQEVGMLLVNKTKCWCKMSDLENNIVREGVVRVGDFSESADMEEPYSFDASFVGIGKPIFEAKNAPLPPGSTRVYFGTYENIEDVTEELILSWDSVLIESGGSVIIPFVNSSYLFNGFAILTGYPDLNHWQEVNNPINEGSIEIGGLFQPLIEIGQFDFYGGDYEIPLTTEYLIY